MINIIKLIHTPGYIFQTYNRLAWKYKMIDIIKSFRKKQRKSKSYILFSWYTIDCSIINTRRAIWVEGTRWEKKYTGLEKKLYEYNNGFTTEDEISFNSNNCQILKSNSKTCDNFTPIYWRLTTQHIEQVFPNKANDSSNIWKHFLWLEVLKWKVNIPCFSNIMKYHHFVPCICFAK